MTIRMHNVVMLQVANLKPMEDSPKKEIGAQQLAGLRASIKEYGFAGILNVAQDPDGSHTVIDGNTRLEELEAAGIQEAPCYVHDDMSFDKPGSRTRRMQFAISFDRQRKVYDEKRVLSELKEMVARGADVAKLSVLAGTPKLKRIIDEDRTEFQSDGMVDTVKDSLNEKTAQKSAMESMVLYGPAEDIERIKTLIRSFKGRFTASAKVSMMLEQANANMDVEDDVLLGIFLSTIAAFQAVTLGLSEVPGDEADD